MYKSNYEFFNASVKIPLQALPPEAWTVISGGDPGDGKRLWASVAWMYACLDTRAKGVSTMPWTLLRGETEAARHDDASFPRGLEWLADLDDLLYMTAAAELACGRAYWMREQNTIRTLGVRWLDPYSITPKWGDRGALAGFTRRYKNRDMPFRVEDVIYFWPADWEREIGPAKTYPALVAARNAGVLDAMDKFADDYFKRGMVKATLLKYLEPIPQEEADQVKEWWRRVFTGIKNAFATEVVRGDFEPVVIGEGLSDLADDVLTRTERRSIEVAFGLPETKLNQAANLATKQQDNQEYLLQVVVPHANHLAGVLNRQLFGPMGYTLKFMPQELPDLQQNENERADAVSKLTAAGMPLLMALDKLGYDLTEAERAELEEMKRQKQEQSAALAALAASGAAQRENEPPQNGSGPPNPDKEEERDTLRRWIRNRQRAGKALVGFRPDYLTESEVEAIIKQETAVAEDTPFYP